MNELTPYHTIAQAVRVEHDLESDTIYLVFKVVDESFRQQIIADWTQDLEVKLINKNLVMK